MILKIDAKFEEKLICCFKNDKNLVNFDPSLENLHFDWFLLCKVHNVWPKNVQRNYFSWQWTMLQNLKKKRKVSKLGLWWESFIQSRKIMSLKFTEESCVMTMKNDAKFEEKSTCRFKIEMANLTNFDTCIRKSQKLAL